MIDARIVANYVLRHGEARGRALTNLTLQKIVYFLHGEWLVRTGSPLVSGNFEAWQFGPVHRVLYDAFREYGDAPVEAPAQRYDPIRRKVHPLPDISDIGLREFLDETLPHYIDLPPFVMVQQTHAAGTPWSITMENAEKRANVGMVIDNDLIERHFEGASDKQSGSRRHKRTAA
jgi:uncharacterized phage-associated protein